MMRRDDRDERLNALSHRIIGCAMEVHSTLGPGLLERVYEEALAYELREAELEYERQKEIVIPYKAIRLPVQRLDLVVESTVVVELKATEDVAPVHLAQLVSYLRAARLPLGLVINFNERRLKDGIFRRINNDTVQPAHRIRT